MNIKKILIAMLAVLVVIGVGYGVWMSLKKQVNEVSNIEGVSIIVVSNQVFLNTDSDPVSMINLTIKGDGSRQVTGFVSSKAGFNSEFKNTVIDGVLKLSLGAMKSTADLPKGKVFLGEIKTTGNGKLILESGLATIPALAGVKPFEINLLPMIIAETK